MYTYHLHSCPRGGEKEDRRERGKGEKKGDLKLRGGEGKRGQEGKGGKVEGGRRRR